MLDNLYKVAEIGAHRLAELQQARPFLWRDPDPLLGDVCPQNLVFNVEIFDLSHEVPMHETTEEGP